jgi:AcrR family transcriptional regulator
MATTIRKAKRPRASKKSAARSAMLEAARRLAARSGVADLTLVAVAEEAGFAPPTVYGQFRSKDELLLAVVADDLAAMASLMRGVFPEDVAEEVERPETPEPASVAVIPEAESSAESPAASLSTKRRLSLVKDDEPVIGNGATPEGDRPRVDAWLERRLRVFEHTLSQIERRMSDTERGTARAIDLSEQGIKSLFERLESFESQQRGVVQHLSQRVEDTERRQTGTAAELRAATNDASARLDALEGARHSEPQPLQQEPVAAADPTESVAHTETPQPAAENVEAPASPAPDDYLAAARRAASAAAMLADIDDKRKSGTRLGWRSLADARIRLSRKHYVIVACAAIIAFVAGAFVAFYVGEAQGRTLLVSVTGAAQQQTELKPVRMKFSPPPVRASTQTPLDHLSSLANAGDAKAELIVGLKYLHGEGVVVSIPEAAKWIRRAAEQHEPIAQYWLATLFEHGDGMAADAAEAVRWYEAAAGQGNRKAMHALGLAYAEGRGAQKDMSEAARWFAKAAALGLVNSQFNLGVLYERGQGVPQSLLNAYQWYAVAATQGDRESKAHVEILKTQLSAEDLAAGERAAANFQPQRIDPAANDAPAVAALASNAVR